MIPDAFIGMNARLFGMLIELLPSADITILSYITSNLAGLKSALVSINWFFPIDTLFKVLSFVFLLETLSLSSKVLFWIMENVSVGIFKAPR